MSASRPGAPSRGTGLPPGVHAGPLGQRFGAYVIDSLVPAAAGVVAATVGRTGTGSPAVAGVVGAVLVSVAWAVVCWWQLAVRAATPGMRATKIQLVGLRDGRPVGWGRVFLRWLVVAGLSATGVGLVLLVVSILTNPRHQGWHDRAVAGVVIARRPLAPARPRPAARPRAAGGSPTAPTARPPAQGSGTRPAPAPVAAPVAGDPSLPLEPIPQAAVEPLPERAEQPRPAAAATNGTRRTILEGWVAELDDGREVRVRGLVLLGRNPQPEEGEAEAELVKLADESRTVSKTHLALGVDDAGPFVVDRGSTNGSMVTVPGAEPVRVGAFRAVPVSAGSVVSIGDHWLRIRREGA